MSLGRNIRFVRIAAGLKQGEMAKRLEITQNYLSLLENDKAEPSLALLRRLCRMFRVPLTFLLMEEEATDEGEDPEMEHVLSELQDLLRHRQQARRKARTQGPPKKSRKRPS